MSRIECCIAEGRGQQPLQLKHYAWGVKLLSKGSHWVEGLEKTFGRAKAHRDVHSKDKAPGDREARERRLQGLQPDQDGQFP
jgi:hypothetical protein